MAKQLIKSLPILMVFLLTLAAAMQPASASISCPAQASAVAYVAPAAVEERQNATLTMVASTASATAGSNVTLSGSITPLQTGSVFLYYSLNNETLFLFAAANLSAGSYSYNTTLTNAGDYYYCAVWAGNDAYNPTTSNIVSVTSQAAAQPAGSEYALLIVAALAVVGIAAAALFLRRKR
jgi:hypothetical protein